jgi:hypothetical protein
MTEFSAELLAAWRRCRRGGNEEARAELDRLIGLKPWQVSPLDADDGPSPWPAGCAGADSWPRAQALRRQLDEAARRRPAKPVRERDDDESGVYNIHTAAGPQDAE